MYAQVEKPKENKGRAVANSVAQKKSNVKQGFGFVDNRLACTQMNVIQGKWFLIDGDNTESYNMKSNGDGTYSYEGKTYKPNGKRSGFKEIVELVEDDSMVLDDFDSDSDSDFEGIKSARIDGLKKIDKRYHVTNRAPRKPKKTTNDLEKDASAIHSAAGGDNRLTVVCAQFITSQGDYLYITTVNKKLMPPKGRTKAEGLGYSVIYGTKTHAEGNLIIYAEKHKNDLIYKGHGCDKGACGQCVALLTHEYGNEVDYGNRGKTGKFSKTYFHGGFLNLSSTKLIPYRKMIGDNYTRKGFRK